MLAFGCQMPRCGVVFYRALSCSLGVVPGRTFKCFWWVINNCLRYACDLHIPEITHHLSHKFIELTTSMTDIDWLGSIQDAGAEITIVVKMVVPITFLQCLKSTFFLQCHHFPEWGELWNQFYSLQAFSHVPTFCGGVLLLHILLSFSVLVTPALDVVHGLGLSAILHAWFSGRWVLSDFLDVCLHVLAP